MPLLSFALAVLFSTASILSLGFLIASVVPTARFAQPVGALVLYPMLGLSGLFVPIDALPPAAADRRAAAAADLRGVAAARHLARRGLVRATGATSPRWRLTFWSCVGRVGQGVPLGVVTVGCELPSARAAISHLKSRH